MLVEFTVKNYRSIKDEQTLSLVKTEGEERNCFTPKIPQNIALSSSAVIYGANAAGKSNLLLALAFFKSMIIKSSISKQQGDKINVTPFLFNDKTAQEPSEFELVFISKGVKYQYGFSLNEDRILEEWLIAFPNGRPQEWFSRIYNAKTNKSEYKFGNHLSGQKQVWKNATRNNALFLSTAIQLNSEQLQPVFDWFKEKFKYSTVSGWKPSFTFSECESVKKKTKILNLLVTAGISEIIDIKIENEEFDPSTLPTSMSKSLKNELSEQLKGKKQKKVKTIHKTNNNELVDLEFKYESEGTQKFFSLAGPWLDTLDKGNVLIIDELHNSLHPKLVKHLVELFHNKKSNPNNAQLIFTTHDTSILNQDVFARDQIWFCEKDEQQSTVLYPLTDFSPRKGRENLEQKYMSGRYGGIPFIKEFELVKEA